MIMMEGWICGHPTDLRSHPCWRMSSRPTLGMAACTAASEPDRASVWQHSSDAAICFLSFASKTLLESGSSASFTSSLSSWAHSSASWLLLTVKEVLDSFPELRSAVNKKMNVSCIISFLDTHANTHICFKYVYFSVVALKKNDSHWGSEIEVPLVKGLGPTWLPSSCRRAIGEVATSSFMRLQRQKLPLILDNMTVVYGLHLQLHIPVRIPERQNMSTPL